MKRFLSILLMVVSLTAIKAQMLETTSKPYGSYGHSMVVIKPTVRNFITLLNLSEAQFESAMKQNRYFERNGEGRYRTFWNGSLDNYAYAKCVNTFNYNVMRDEIRFFVSKDMIYPTDAITSLFRDLRPYYRDSKRDSDGHNVDFFAFKKDADVYEFYITTYSDMFDVQVIKTSNQ